MKNAIILHGTCDREEYYSDVHPSASNSHRIPWLQKQLLMRDIQTITPEMFQPYSPNYIQRKKEFEKNEITDESILVWHSCGWWFIIRWLSENKQINVGKVMLIAPWLDPEDTKWNDFFEFTVDSDLVSRTQWVKIFSSSNDDEDVKKSISILLTEITGVTVKEFENYGHFCLSDMETEKFPELLEEILK